MNSLRLGYGLNGFAGHRLPDACAVVAGLGYDGVALTLDQPHLDPYADDLSSEVARARDSLQRHRLAVVVETGSRYVLDPWHKHEPTLVSEHGRERRTDLLLRAVRIAHELDAEVMSCWSGTLPAGTSTEEGWQRVVAGLGPVLDEAAHLGVTVCFEPEPGMLVDRLESFESLLTTVGRPDRLGLTLDLGHCVCLEDEPVADCVRRASPRLVHVHVEDMRRGVHEHLDFGEGELDLPVALAALEGVGYRGLVAVELSRHSHAADTVVPRAIRVLREAERMEVLIP